MEPAKQFNTRTVLILKGDRLYAESLKQHIIRCFPRVHVRLTSTVAEADKALTAEPVDLLVTGVGISLDGDVFELLAERVLPRRRAQRMLVVTCRREYRLLTALRAFTIDGLFDTNGEEPERFIVALRAVSEGIRYWSPSMLEHMQRIGSSSNSLFRFLTSFEQLVLSIVGGGCDDMTAADELGLSPSTVSTTRRELHRKLGVQHRGELVRIAAQSGFVRFTPSGVVRPGFAGLLATYMARRAKRAERDPQVKLKTIQSV